MYRVFLPRWSKPYESVEIGRLWLMGSCVLPYLMALRRRACLLHARCREEDPEMEIRLFEVSLAQQLKGLHDDLYDAGSMADEVGDGIIVEPAWEEAGRASTSSGSGI